MAGLSCIGWCWWICFGDWPPWIRPDIVRRHIFFSRYCTCLRRNWGLDGFIQLLLNCGLRMEVEGRLHPRTIDLSVFPAVGAYQADVSFAYGCVVLKVLTHADTVENVSTLQSATVILCRKPVQADCAGVLVHLQASIAAGARLPGLRSLRFGLLLFFLLFTVTATLTSPLLSPSMDLSEETSGF